MRALSIAILLALASPALAKDYSVDPPAGWTPQPDTLVEPQLAKLRAVKGTRSVEAALYMSPDNTVQLTVMRWTIDLPNPSRLGLDELDRGMVAGSARQVSKHISDSRHFEGNRMVAAQLDENAGTTIDQARIFQLTPGGVVHMLNVTCAGTGDLSACKAAQKTMDLKVPGAIDIPTAAEADNRSDTDVAYQAGRLVGMLLGVGLVIWLIRRFTRK